MSDTNLREQLIKTILEAELPDELQITREEAESLADEALFVEELEAEEEPAVGEQD